MFFEAVGALLSAYSHLLSTDRSACSFALPECVGFFRDLVQGQQLPRPAWTAALKPTTDWCRRSRVGIEEIMDLVQLPIGDSHHGRADGGDHAHDTDGNDRLKLA